MAQGILSKQLEILRQNIAEKERMKVIQLPLWPDAKRGTPNSFIRSALFSAVQSQNRVFIKDTDLFAQQGITIKFTGEQLNQEDLTLWETLVHMAKSSPLGNSCGFTAHSVLKAMELNTGGKEHKRLHLGIIRLAACIVEVQHENKKYFGSLIKSGVKDELTTHYTIELNRELIKLYGETNWTAIDWDQRLKLRRKLLAQALHAYYSSHRVPYPVKLSTLQLLTGSKNEQASSFKRQIRTALEHLIKIDFLHSYSIQGDSVIIKRIVALAG